MDKYLIFSGGCAAILRTRPEHNIFSYTKYILSFWTSTCAAILHTRAWYIFKYIFLHSGPWYIFQKFFSSHICAAILHTGHDTLIHIFLICFPIFFHILRPSSTPDHDKLIHIFLNIFSTSFSHLCGHLTHRTSTSSDAAARVFPHSQNDWRREVGTEKFLLLQIWRKCGF